MTHVSVIKIKSAKSDVKNLIYKKMIPTEILWNWFIITVVLSSVESDWNVQKWSFMIIFAQFFSIVREKFLKNNKCLGENCSSLCVCSVLYLNKIFQTVSRIRDETYEIKMLKIRLKNSSKKLLKK